MIHINYRPFDSSQVSGKCSSLFLNPSRASWTISITLDLFQQDIKALGGYLAMSLQWITACEELEIPTMIVVANEIFSRLIPFCFSDT